jgi:hypothetical protein
MKVTQQICLKVGSDFKTSSESALMFISSENQKQA